jgi:hypothetical protein
MVNEGQLKKKNVVPSDHFSCFRLKYKQIHIILYA